MTDIPHELSLSRFIKASPETVWKVFTERPKEWFCPRPWTTPVAEIDLFSGGRFNFTLQSPEGEQHPYKGVVLEITPARKLVATGAMTQGWVPQAGDMSFVRMDTFEPENGGTRYTTRARHWNADDAAKHKAMGFEEGWGAVADQLAELAEAEA